MARHKVEITGVNTANIKVLSNEEMLDLFLKLKENNPFAREDLIYGNLRLVLSILKSFNNKVDNMDDLFQVGCIGLVKAIDNFDTSFNVKFSTYAVPMIVGEIKRYLRDNNAIRVSRSVKDLAYKTLKLKEELMDPLGKEPSNKKIAEILNVSEYDITSALDAMREPISMYEPIYNDGGDTIYLFDQLSQNDEKIELDLKMAVNKAIEKLKPKEKKVITERFLEGKTQVEIASDLGISQAQISRLEKSGLENIKRMII